MQNQKDYRSENEKTLCRNLWFRVLFAGVLVWVAMTLSSCSGSEEMLVEADLSEQESVQSDSSQTDEGAFSGNQIYVYVCGAVKSPGVYQLPEEARMFQAIERAGGMTEQAEGDSLNLAQALSDGERVYVPVKGEVQTQAGENGSGQQGKIDINTAGKEELMTLPGIGESKAESIISYRERKGTFRKIEDLMQIEGIKDGVFQKIKEHIRV